MHRLRYVILFLLLTLAGSELCAQKLGYALSGGGARGFAHIGVLKVLEEEGLKPDYIGGTSIGAIIGGLYAIGYSPAEIESICVAIDWPSLVQDQHSRGELYIGQKRWAPYGNAIFELDDNWHPQLPSSVYMGNQINLDLFRLFAPASQVSDFSQFPIPFVSNATDLITGQPKTFVSGSLMQAVRASMSIPSLLRPFEIDGHTYIDGGISQNLPINLLHEQGAEKVIAIKVNSSLRDGESLTNLVDVLDQTINIGITNKLNEHLDSADLILEPDFNDLEAINYTNITEIIAAGERAARAQVAQIRAFKATLSPSPRTPNPDYDKQLDRFTIQDIRVHGSNHISPAKTREYLGLRRNRTYSTSEIYGACVHAWNSQAYNTIYPVLERAPGGRYILNVYITERQRRQLALNLAYTSEDKLMAGSLLSLTNCLQKNSRLLSEVRLGGKNELNIDYVKNFGEQWGAYFRIFPYLNEKTLYVYRDHQKIKSVKSLEWGFTSGVGIFARDLAIAEGYVFSSKNRLYSDIAEEQMLPTNNLVSGFGVKLYHESLDDYIFPTRGLRISDKFVFSRNAAISDYLYSSFLGSAEAYLPLYDGISLRLGTEVGSYFNSENTDRLDPFVFGGADGFMGYSRYEVSAPHYQIITTGLNLRAKHRWFTQAGFQWLRYSDRELWGVQKDWEYCIYTGLGYNSSILPVRFYVAMNENKAVNTLLSVGYDFDIFRFSRK